jgi:hypothetical protein
MKSSTTRMPTRGGEYRLGLRGWAPSVVDQAALLTLGAATLMVLSVVTQSDPDARAAGAVTVLVVWLFTLTIDCLMLIAVGIWGLGKRLAPTRMRGVAPPGGLWDQAIDGPEPLRPST